MIQTLHIFRKDARRFAYEICVVAALTVAFVWSQIANDIYTAGVLSFYLHLAAGILPIAWWYVISLLIHQESLIGDRQFWITRPYSRGSMFAAKALFIVMFVNVPMLLAGCVILAVAGFRPLAYVPNLLWMQLVSGAVFVLPPLALASLTRTLAQFALTILGLLAGFVGLILVISDPFVRQGTHRLYWSQGLGWADSVSNTLLVAAPALLVLLVQWGARKRWIAVSAGIVLFVLLHVTESGLSWRLCTEVQARMFGERGAASTAVTLNAGEVTSDSLAETDGRVALAARFRVSHIPVGETAAPESVEMTFEGQGGARWSTGRTLVVSSEADVLQTNPEPDGTFAWWQRVVMDRGFYERVRRGPVTIRGSVYLMLNVRQVVGLPENRTTAVPGGGVCSVSVLRPRHVRFWLVNCRAPFHVPFKATDEAAFLEIAEPDLPRAVSGKATRLLSFWDSPLPADFGIGMSPLSIANEAGPRTEFFFLRYEPRAYVRRYFEVANVQLR
jgi:hypothetical protein